MKINATLLPLAAVAAPLKSVSLVDEAMTLWSCAALVVMAAKGYQKTYDLR